jgi:hypothetical protein
MLCPVLFHKALHHPGVAHHCTRREHHRQLADINQKPSPAGTACPDLTIVVLLILPTHVAQFLGTLQGSLHGVQLCCVLKTFALSCVARSREWEGGSGVARKAENR